MKSMIIVLALLAVGTASAGEYSVMSKVVFQSASTFVPANKVCTQSGNIFHKTKSSIEVPYCDESDSGSKSNCKIVAKPLVQPMKSKAQRCAKFESDSSGGDCLVWETYTLNQGKSGKITVYVSKDAYEAGSSPVAVKTFAIPSCGTAAN